MREAKNKHMHLHYRHYVYVPILVVLGIFFVGLTSWHSSDKSIDKGKLLVIHSYKKDFVSYPDMNRMIVDNLRKKGINAEIQTFYLNCDALNAETELSTLYQYIDTMHVKPSIILTTDDQATYSLLASQHSFIKQIPVVFTGVNFPNWELLKKYPNATGIWDKMDFQKNVEMIEQLFGPRRIRFFYDTTVIGKKIIEEIATQLGNRDEKLYDSLTRFLDGQDAFINLTEFGTGYLKEMTQVDKKPETSSFYFLNLRQEQGSNLLWLISGEFEYSVSVLTRYDYTMVKMGRMGAMPTFSSLNKGVGYKQGLMGGYLTTLEDEIAEGCDYVAQILKGKRVANLPIKEATKSYILDWEELGKWDVSPDVIPGNYKIINKPFYEEHKAVIVLLTIAAVLLIVAIIGYLIYLYIREAKRRHSAMLNLWEEKEFLSMALEGGNIFAWRYDEKLDEFTFDKDFLETVGLKQRKLKLDEMTRMTHPDEVEYAIGVFINIVNHQEDKASLRVRMDFNGEGYVWYEFRMLDITNILEGKPSVIGVVLNIQEIKETEEQLISARDMAAKTELKQSFLANMSHEIRTPLNAIVGFSNMLASDEELGEEEKHEFIVTINKNCELLLKLINDILEISRIESGNMSFSYELYDIGEVIEEVYQMNQPLIPHDISFIKNIPEEKFIVYTDGMRLKQVVLNFVNNAFKFTTSGHVEIGVEYDKINNELGIYVEDTGMGIPDQEQKMIFERFYKCDEFVQGTGLGLSISMVIAKRLNGRITLTSKEGKGSRFCIVIPYEAPVGEEMELTNEDHAVAMAEETIDETRPVILIAEDSVSNYMVLSRILKKHFSIIWTVNGKDAVEVVSKRRVDLVLMDIKMHEMDGITAMKKIKKTNKNLPVIIQTAYAYDENREQAQKAGCAGFIVKPVRAEELLQVVEKYITGKLLS